MRDNNLKIVIQLDAKGNMSKGIKDATGKLDKFDATAKTASTSADRLASAIRRLGHYGTGAALTLLPALGIGKFLQEVGQFETAMLRLQATSSASAQQMADLQAQARELGASSIYSAQQAAEAQTFLAQAGFRVNEFTAAQAA